MQISTKTGVVQAILSASPNSENIETPLAASQVPGEIPATGFDIGSGKTHHEGNIDGNFSAGLHNALSNPITPIDPGEDIDKDRANVAVQQKQPEGCSNAVRRSATADIESGTTAGMFNHVHGYHRQPRSLTMQPISPSRPI